MLELSSGKVGELWKVKDWKATVWESEKGDRWEIEKDDQWELWKEEV